MKYRVSLGALLLIGAPILCDEHDYQEQLETAIVQTNVLKVSRLLKRRNKISVKDFQNMLGWAHDIIEERRMLEPTTRETSVAVMSTIAGGLASMYGLRYYFDFRSDRSDVRASFPGEEKGYLGLLGTVGFASCYGFYKWWSGPRKRMAQAYDILFAIEDAVDAIEKKKKARALQAKIRQSEAKGSR